MNMAELLTLKGSCHCGAVTFEALVSKQLKVVKCNCSMCKTSGYQHVFVEHDNFTLLRGQDALSEYRFGTKTARHLFCKHCGVKSFYQPRSHPESYSVHLTCCSNVNDFDIAYEEFDGQNWEDAIDSLYKND